MYKSILVPLDGSSHAEKALPHVTKFAPEAEKITLLCVIHRIDDLVGTRQPDPASSNELTEDMLTREAYDAEVRDANRTLAAAKSAVGDKLSNVHTMITEGDAGEEILKAAQGVSADLIVITSFGSSASSTPPSTGIFGRVSDAVLKNARAPVLVIKP